MVGGTPDGIPVQPQPIKIPDHPAAIHITGMASRSDDHALLDTIHSVFKDWCTRVGITCQREVAGYMLGIPPQLDPRARAHLERILNEDFPKNYPNMKVKCTC